MIQTEHLNIGYGNHIVQTDLNLQAKKGHIICMLGRNGCGKSTLLRTIAGLQPCLAGKVLYDNRDINTLTHNEKAKLMALVLTERASMDSTQVIDVVTMGRYPYTNILGKLTEKDEDAISTAINQVGLKEKAHSYFNQLSDGEKQRVLIAKALAQETPLILLDEPTAHLDLPNRIRTLLLLKTLAHETDKCVIISTHELDLALQTADEIWLMTPQKGIKIGSPSELITTNAFQEAFEDDLFIIKAKDGELSIQVKSSMVDGNTIK